MTTRRGYTLVELVLSMSVATVLMAGLSSSLFIALEAFSEQPASVIASKASEIQRRLLADVGRATAFTARSADTITFTVADETGDGVEETVTYAYDSGAETLMLVVNGVVAPMLTGVSGSEFGFLERDMPGSAVDPVPYDQNDWGKRWAGILFEAYGEQGDRNANTLDVPTPDDTAAGDLLVAAIVSDMSEPHTPPVGEGWNEVAVHQHGGTNLFLGVWWKNAGVSEPASHGFSHANNADMFGWIMRVTGHDPIYPIHAVSAMSAGSGSSPLCPAVTTTVDGAMIVRIGGFDDDDVTIGDPGLSGHLAIAMNQSDGSGTTCSGGAGYVKQGAAGDAGTAQFALTASEEWITLTLAIAPE